MLRLIMILVPLVLPSFATACNVPVFRYALERWQPDACEIVIFHDGEFSELHKGFVRQLSSASFENDGVANVKIRQQHVASSMDDSLAAIWEALKADVNISLPYVVVRSLAGKSTFVNNWRGSVDEAMQANLLQSPVRSEVSRRLCAGDSAVWMVLKSEDEDRNNAVTELLNRQLKQLSEDIPLPDGIGLPGSELFSEVPLLMRFSVLEIDPGDKQEQLLVRLLHGLDPASKKAGEPLVVPVFGRGRALEVIPANQVDDGLIEDLTLFLCGACSCQVKERNPGFDLLLNTDWNKELFGDGAEDIASKMTSAEKDIALPVMLVVPPGPTGKKAKQSQFGDMEVSYSPSSEQNFERSASDTASPVLGIMIGLILAVLAIVLFRGGRA